MLEKRSLCVCEIRYVLQLSNSTVSSHLSILKDAGLVSDRKDGKWVYYSLSDISGNLAMLQIRALLAGWLNDDEIISADTEKLESLTLEEACKY